MKRIVILLMIPLAQIFASGVKEFNPEMEILGMPTPQEQNQFVTEQNERTKNLLASVDPNLTKAVTDRAGELAAKNAPTKVNYFGADHFVKDGNVVKVEAGVQETVIPSTVLPPNAKFSAYRYSPDKKFIAYGYSMFGSDWQIWNIYDLVEKKNRPEEGNFIFKNFGGPVISWTPDSRKIIYPGENSLQDDFVGNQNPTIKIHTLGTDPSQDQILFKDFETVATSRWGAAALTNDQAVVFRTQGVAVIPTVAMLTSFSGHKRHIQIPNRYLGNSPGNAIVGTSQSRIYFRSASAGDRFGITVFDLQKPTAIARTLIPADPQAVLYQAQLLGDKILTQYIGRDLKISFKLYDLKGSLVAQMKPSDFGFSDLSHPSLPLTDGDATSTAGYFTFSSVKMPPVTFKVDTIRNTFEMIPNSADVNFDSSKILETSVVYTSEDGAKIPMLIYQRADLQDQPAAFAYLYSYGFIGIPNLSQWNRKFQLALELGGVVAIPMLRGGGEFGAAYQLSGTNDRWKTFKDLVAASRWLKKNMKLQQDRVIAVGRSFGGLSGAVHFVHHQNEFSLISAIVPVPDWEKHFLMSGWWMGDDFGIQRDPFTRKASIEARKKLIEKNKSWDAAANLPKIAGKKLIPTIFFSGQYDTNTTPLQTARFMNQVLKQNPGEPVYMLQHPNGGHGARAELVDEFVFIAKMFDLKELKPLKK